MERGSPENSATSSLMEESKHNSVMPHFLEKRPRLFVKTTREEQTSYLALLTGAESPEAEADAADVNVMHTTPTQMRPTVVEATNLELYHDINLTTNDSATTLINKGSSTLKRKTVCKDTLNPNTRNFFGVDQIQGYNSTTYGSTMSMHGYTVYDERYQAHGLPVDPHLRMFNAIYGNGNAGFS